MDWCRRFPPLVGDCDFDFCRSKNRYLHNLQVGHEGRKHVLLWKRDHGRYDWGNYDETEKTLSSSPSRLQCAIIPLLVIFHIISVILSVTVLILGVIGELCSPSSSPSFPTHGLVGIGCRVKEKEASMGFLRGKVGCCYQPNIIIEEVPEVLLPSWRLHCQHQQHQHWGSVFVPNSHQDKLEFVPRMCETQRLAEILTKLPSFSPQTYPHSWLCFMIFAVVIMQLSPDYF